MSYTPNPFDLLGDEGDERPRKQAVKPAAPKPTPPPAATKAQETQPSKSAPAKPSPSAAKKEELKAKPKGDAPKGKTDAAPKKPSAQTRAQPQSSGVSNYESEKPARPTKDRRDGPQRAPARGRQNDRKSGTGRPTNEVKKEGSGKANWGKLGEDAQEEAEAAKEPVEGETEEAAPAEGEAVPERPKTPEIEYKGYDEYLESIKNRTVKGVEAPKIRAAGEGVDQSAWAGYAPIEKDDEEDSNLKKKKTVKKETNANVKDGKVAVDKVFKVSMPPPQGVEERQRGGDRGGRGGRGGKGSSRGGRGGRQQQGQRPDTTKASFEAADFPALGGAAPAAAPQASAPATVKA